MAKTSIGQVRYINDFSDAPKSAEYIIRIMDCGSTVYFEKYEEKYYQRIQEFYVHDMYDKNEFQNFLRECRKLAGNNKTIWTEKPVYMLFDFRPYDLQKV